MALVFFQGPLEQVRKLPSHILCVFILFVCRHVLHFLNKTATEVVVSGQTWDEQINFSDDRIEKFMDKSVEIHVQRLYRLISYCADLKIQMYGLLFLDEKKECDSCVGCPILLALNGRRWACVSKDAHICGRAIMDSCNLQKYNFFW